MSSKSKKSISKYFGPSTLVAAAFIGPGTLTTCTLAGVNTGYTLLWAMVFSIGTTIVLQEMSARLGWATGSGLGEAVSQQFKKGVARYVSFFLIIGAIIVGNAAYEAGNLSGGVLGLELTVGASKYWALVLGGLSFLLLMTGAYKLIEKTLIALVILMSLCFLITVILVRPDWSAFFGGFIPSNIEDNSMLIMGLIGTTVVPYNLFLHASTISKKWGKDSELSDVRMENRVAILLGGVISMLIIITAAASQTSVGEVASAADLAVQLEPAFGKSAKYFMGIGLMAAGISSALTAPLAAAYAAKGLFNWKADSWNFKLVWMFILLIGVSVAMLGIKPIAIIKFAQITNALLLPFIAAFLWYASNNKKLLGQYVNSKWNNTIVAFILLIIVALSIVGLGKVF